MHLIETTTKMYANLFKQPSFKLQSALFAVLKKKALNVGVDLN